MKIIEKALLSLIVFLYCTLSFHAQERCGTDQILREMAIENPFLLNDYEKSFRDFYSFEKRNAEDISCPIIIPVHIIILHHPEDEIGIGTNLSEERILSQLAVLNQDFSRTNPDTINTPPEFRVGDTGIRFCLATRDPEGNTTTGITRYSLKEKYNIGEDPEVRRIRTKIKEKTGWDRKMYLNIWVAPTLEVLGFAKVPTQTFLPRWNDDGANVHTEVFGGPGYAEREFYNQGRTLTHEVGHFLGLGHIWRSNGCSLDDGIADTPLQNHATTGCPSHPQYSCGNEGDMFMNYMDYTYDACMNAFTIDQGSYMRTILNTSRSSLITAAEWACPEKLFIETQVLVSSNPSCPGGNDGFIEVGVCGGASNNYRISLNGGTYTSSSIFSNLPAGVYEIQVKNLFGNVGNLSIELKDPNPVLVEKIQTEDIKCFGDKNGQIKITLSQETSEVDVLFSLDGSRFQKQPFFQDLVKGDYTVFVQSPAGCVETYEVTIASPEKLSLEIEKMVIPSCFGFSDGVIQYNGIGGVPSYTYSIDGTTFQPTGQFTGLGSDPYDLYVKDTNGCLYTADYMLLQPQQIKANIEEINSISCNGSSDAAIEITTSGGSGEVLISLENQDFNKNRRYENLVAGDYILYTKDEKGCSFETPFVINEPDPLEIIQITTTDVLCAGEKTGKITVDVNGGTTPFIYTINGQNQTSPTFDNLSEGIYKIIVTDQNGCQVQSEKVIGTKSEISMDVISQFTPTCYAGTNGSIVVKAKGGSGEYSYSIDNKSYQEEPFFNNLSSGSLLIYIKDINNCVAAVPASIDTAKKITFNNLSTVDPTCSTINNGSISFHVTGGEGDLALRVNGNPVSENTVNQLSNGNYIIEAIDNNLCKVDTFLKLEGPPGIEIQLNSITETNCPQNLLGSVYLSATGGNGALTFSLPGRSNQSGYFDKLSGGNNTVEVYDNSGCKETFTFEVPVIGGLDLEISSLTLPTCFDSNNGEVIMTARGGQGKYTYLLGDQINKSGQFRNLPGGYHSFVVQDSFGCVGTLNTQLETPPIIKIDTVFFKEPTCYNLQNGIIDIDATGGKSPILFRLNNVQNYSGAFNNLLAGTYSVELIDGNGCTITENITLNQPERIRAVDIDLKSPTCHGKDNGSIGFSVEGGKGNKIIKFDDRTYSNNIYLENLKAGNYRVRMSDQNSCNEILDIFLEEPGKLVSEDTVIVPETFNSLGELTVKYSGGTQPYLFALDNGDYIVENTFDQLIAGEYSLHVLDAQNCYDRIFITVPYDDGFENPDGTISEVWISYQNRSNKLHFTLHGDQNIQYQIYSIDGKLMSTKNLYLEDGYHQIALEVNQWPKGTYIVHLNAEKDYSNLKLVKY